MAEALILIAAAAVLLRICWTDLLSLKIRNRDLLILLGIAIGYLILAQPPDLLLRFVFAAILFGLGFVFWLFGKLGAGDAKLFGVVGCLVPPDQMLPFAAIMLAISILMYFVLFQGDVIGRYFPLAGKHFEKLSKLNRLPYGVAISLATIVVVVEALIAGPR